MAREPLARQSDTRVRVGQKYLESGKENTPTVRYVEVVTIDPLVVQPEVWEGKRGLDQQPYDRDALLKLPLVYDPELSAEELREALVGQRVVEVEVSRDDSDWPQGDGDTTLVLDDGRRVSFAAWGYDSWGLGARVHPPLEGEPT